MFNKLKKLFFSIDYYLLLLIVFSGVLRFVNLGYSDYQGDEIKSFVVLEPGQSTVQFLLDQKKGPGQFIVTFLVKHFDSDFSNEFFVRFPFAVAGFLAVVFFYLLLSKYFEKRIAFYSALFLAVNGFFVAFSRISQYQSFVILFMILSLLSFTLAVESDSFQKKGLFLGFLFFSLSILFHYDGVFIAPFVFYLIIKWCKKYDFKVSVRNKSFTYFIFCGLISFLLLASFYIPFLLNINESTLAYWNGRISGNVAAKLSSSRYLFTVYQPIYAIHFYTMLTISGFILFFINISKKFTSKIKILKTFFIKDNNIINLLFFLFWFLLPFFVMEILVYVPGTHIYTYLLPMFIFLGLGIYLIERFLMLFRKLFIPSIIIFFGLASLFTFLFLQSYSIFVDNKKEYPWEDKEFLVWELNKPSAVYHLSLFGFPYFRNWEEIRNIVMQKNNGFYSGNERTSISRYYIPLEKNADNAGYYVYILNPQTLTNEFITDKAEYWASRYNPVYTFSKNGTDLVRVYNMETGTLKELIKKGF